MFLPDIVAQLTEITINLLKNKFTGLGLEGQLAEDIYSVVKPEVYLHGEVDRLDTHKFTYAL